MSDYIKKIKYFFLYCITVAFIICGFYACASIGSPQGGSYDLAPPKVISSMPDPNAVEYNGKRVEITFDELIQLEKPSEKIIITPPQKQLPAIRAMGKKVRVDFLDSLIPNTTYTIDFTDAIIDNNERNPLENFSFAFSTGATVDSLIVSGYLLNAENLEPMPNIMIGLHTNPDDTAFLRTPFVRTTKTNDKGRFWVRNITPGSYHIFALNDQNRDYAFNQPGEDIAFLDSMIIPGFEPAIRHDTIWKDSLTIDTIVEVKFNRFTPDNLVLSLFKEKFERRYLTKSERPDAHLITFNFASPVQTPPELKLLNKETDTAWFIPEYVDNGTALHCWITDSTIFKMDSLFVETTYFKSDSLNQPVLTTDTLKFIQRKGKTTQNEKKKGKEKIDFLGINISAQATMDVYDTLKITFSEPVENFDPNLIKIDQKVDTLWEPRDFVFVRDSLNPRSYYIDHLWDYGLEYRLNIDSTAFFSIYGKWNSTVKTNFRLRKQEEYGNIVIPITGTNGQGFGELMDSSDKPVKKSPVENRELIFNDIKPGKYYIRFIEDSNGNGVWDTGNYLEKKQPEQVYYYPNSFDVRANWDIDSEQAWNVSALPLYKQKPLEITKNKPAEKKKKRNEENTNTSNQRTNANKNTQQGQTTHPH